MSFGSWVLLIFCAWGMALLTIVAIVGFRENRGGKP